MGSGQLGRGAPMRADSFGEGCGGVRRRAEGCRGVPKSAEECGGVRRSAEGGKVERRFGGRVEGGLEATWSSVRASGADLGRGRATGRSYLEASGAAGTARHGRVARVARRARHGTPALCGTAGVARHGTVWHVWHGGRGTALRHTARHPAAPPTQHSGTQLRHGTPDTALWHSGGRPAPTSTTTTTTRSEAGIAGGANKCCFMYSLNRNDTCPDDDHDDDDERGRDRRRRTQVLLNILPQQEGEREREMKMKMMMVMMMMMMSVKRDDDGEMPFWHVGTLRPQSQVHTVAPDAPGAPVALGATGSPGTRGRRVAP